MIHDADADAEVSVITYSSVSTGFSLYMWHFELSTRVARVVESETVYMYVVRSDFWQSDCE